MAGDSDGLPSCLSSEDGRSSSSSLRATSSCESSATGGAAAQRVSGRGVALAPTRRRGWRPGGRKGGNQIFPLHFRPRAGEAAGLSALGNGAGKDRGRGSAMAPRPALLLKEFLPISVVLGLDVHDRVRWMEPPMRWR